MERALSSPSSSHGSGPASRPRVSRLPHALATGALAALLTAAAPPGSAQSILTVAGGGTDDGKPATQAAVNAIGVAVDGSGNVYVVDYANNRIRKVSAADGTISTIAGRGGYGYSGDGGPATAADLAYPVGIALDRSGNVFVADTSNNRVRRVSAATGVITTVAGLGSEGYTGDGGPATQARLSSPSGVAVDGQGNVFIADFGNNVVRRVAASTGTIATIAGNGAGGFSGDGGPATQARLNGPFGVAVDSSGNVYVTDRTNDRVRKVSTGGTITTVAGSGSTAPLGDGGAATLAGIDAPEGVVVDASGGLVFADRAHQRIRRVTAGGVISTLAGTGVFGYGGDGMPATQASLSDPFGVAVDAAGNVLFAEYFGSRVRRVRASNGVIETVAGNGNYTRVGDGGPATAATLTYPYGAWVEPGGGIVIADTYAHRIRRVDPVTGTISTIAGTGTAGYAGDGGPATQAYLWAPYDVAVAPNGDVYVADGSNRRIRKIERATGTIRLYAGSGGSGSGGDGGPAAAATFVQPFALALDPSGNLYVADAGANRVRRISAGGGLITTVAGGGSGALGDGGPATQATLGCPNGVAIGPSGDLYVSDTCQARVRRVSSQNGTIRTVAGNGLGGFSGDGGPATQAIVDAPTGIAVDTDGTFFFASGSVDRVRRVDGATGIITTIAGNGTRSAIGDGGPATAAGLSSPVALRLDGSGNLTLADTFNRKVRLISRCRGVSAPTLLAPAQAAQGISTAPTFSWTAVPGAFRYDVYLGLSGVTPTLRLVAQDLTSTSFTASNLQPGTQYLWTVWAKGDPYCQPQSIGKATAITFTTVASCTAPPAPAPTAPADGATGIATAPTLTWEASSGAGSYDVNFGTTSPPPAAARGLTTTSLALSNLVAGTTYYWSVTAHASCDAARTASSPVRSFQVAGGCQAPGAFAQTAPAAGATGVSTSALLSWQAAANAARYDLYLGTQADPPLYLAGLTATSLQLSGLVPGATYTWRVVARAACSATLASSAGPRSFTTAGTCATPSAPSFSFVPQGVSAGQTYVIAWNAATGLDASGWYVVERSRDAGFATLLDSQTTASTSASFVASGTGTVYHRVHAVAACAPPKDGPSSATAPTTVVSGSPNVVFTVSPSAVVTTLGAALEDQRSTFTVENISEAPIQVILARQELASVPFFQVVDPDGGDAAFVTLQPRQPKTFQIRYSGPPSSTAGTYQGLVVLSSTGQGLSVTPYAFVNLKVGGAAAAVPEFRVDGARTEYAFFPGWAGDDAGRPSISVDVRNPGSSAMELGLEIGPEVWLQPEAGWNATPIPAGASRTIRLSTSRARAPNGSALPRATYLTVRTKDGASARLLVQDNDAVPVASGRPSQLPLGVRSYLVPSVVHATSAIGRTFVSRLRISNAGTRAVPAQLLFTSATTGEVRRATVVVPAGDVVSLTDPLVQLFGLAPPVYGPIEVRTAAPEDIGLLSVSSGVDAPSPSGGVFGFQMPTVLRGEGARLGSPHFVAGVPENAKLRSNLILAETTGLDRVAGRLVLYDADGNQLGTSPFDLPAYGWQQIGRVVSALGGGSNRSAARIEIETTSGAGAVMAIVTVIDNSNDDSVTYVSRPATAPSSGPAVRRPLWALQATGSQKIVVPALVNGFPTFPGTTRPYSFRSLMGLAAGSASPATFTLTYNDLERGGSTARTVVVDPRKTREYQNVLEELFGVPAGARSQGPLFVEVTGNGTVYAKVYSDLEAGTLGDGFPVVSIPSDGLTGGPSQKPLAVDGLEQSVDKARGTRSNLILNEVLGQPVTVTVRLYEAGNRSRPIAEKDIALQALEKVQLSTVFTGLGLEASDRLKDRTNVECVVTWKSGAGLVSAIVTTIDNQTGDTRNSSLAPSGGVPASGGGGTIGF